MSHKALIMVPVLLELSAIDKHRALQEVRDAMREYQSFNSTDSVNGVFEAKLVGFYEDASLREAPPPPMAA